MKLSKNGWLILGLCTALLISLGFNGWQALHRRFLSDEALTALRADVDSALTGLDSAVYMSVNRADWNDPGFRLGLYKNLLQAEEASAAASQMARLAPGDASAVAASLGRLATQLNSVYLPAAQRVAAGQATTADKASLTGFCDSLRKSGWPLKAQLRDQGWTKLRGSLGALLDMLGPASKGSSVFNVPDYPYEQPADTGDRTGGQDQSSSEQLATSGVSIKLGPDGGA